MVPLTLVFASQLTDAPPSRPSQVQFHGPLPFTPDAVPTVQRSSDGISRCPPTDAEPHTAAFLACAEHVALFEKQLNAGAADAFDLRSKKVVESLTCGFRIFEVPGSRF